MFHASTKHPGLVYILCNWSFWARSGGDGRPKGYLSQSVYYNPERILDSDEFRMAFVCDVAEHLDDIIRAMSLQNRLSEQVAITEKYYWGSPVETMVRYINKNRLKGHEVSVNTVRNTILPAAHSFLDGRIHSYWDIYRDMYLEGERLAEGNK